VADAARKEVIERALSAERAYQAQVEQQAAKEAKRVADKVRAAKEASQNGRMARQQTANVRKSGLAFRKAATDSKPALREKFQAEAERVAKEEAERKAEAERLAKEAAQKAAQAAKGTKGVASAEPASQINMVNMVKDTSAVGDPHLVNMYGQHFDVLREGNHTLIQVPRHAAPEATLLKVIGEAQHLGGACADMYFHSISVKGKWAQELLNSLSHGHRNSSAGFTFLADAAHRSNSTHWTRLGAVLDLKIIWGQTITGVRYLNVFVRHLGDVEASVGGLLGADDHSDAQTPQGDCKRTVSFLQVASAVPFDRGEGAFSELAEPWLAHEQQ